MLRMVGLRWTYVITTLILCVIPFGSRNEVQSMHLEASHLAQITALYTAIVRQTAQLKRLAIALRQPRSTKTPKAVAKPATKPKGKKG